MEDIKNSFSEEDLNRPLKLAAARVWRTGLGGRELDKMLGKADAADSHFSENWIMSTVEARNVGREELADEGLSYLEGTNLTLKEILNTYPIQTLGEAHVEQIGKVPGVLAKINDVAERTTIQVHPDKDTAQKLFHSAFGKTESWHVLSVREDAEEQPGVYLGFKEGITREYWRRMFDEQNIPAMLDCLHYFPVKPGDQFLVQAGVPHAVSAGFMFLEMQEPTDYTIRVERKSPSGFQVADYQCHQGLGFERMFDCFHYNGIQKEEASAKYMVQTKKLEENNDYVRYETVGYDDTKCFKLQRYVINAECQMSSEGVCSGLFVQEGAGKLICDGITQELKVGEQFFVSSCCHNFMIQLTGEAPMIIFRCYGPDRDVWKAYAREENV